MNAASGGQVMKWTFEYVEDMGYIKIVSEGEFSAGEAVQLIEDLLSQPYWRKGIPVLVDNRKLDYSGGGTTAIKEASKFHIANDERIGNGKSALLMKSVTDFGLGRQYELLTDESVSANLHIFMDENQALRWLLS
jgi:hypothetical protein